MYRLLSSIIILTNVITGCRTTDNGTTAVKEVTPSAEAEVLWTCGANSDPDFVKLTIVRSGGKLVARLYEESGDGERVASDAIGLKIVDTGNDAAVEYEQIANSYPSTAWPSVTLSKKTKKARIGIQAFGDGSGVFQAKTGPTGSRDVAYDLICTRANTGGSEGPGLDVVKLLDCEDGEASVILRANALEVTHSEENFSPAYTAAIVGTFQAAGESHYEYVEPGTPTSFVKKITVTAANSTGLVYGLTIKSYTRKAGQPDSLWIVNNWQCRVLGENG